MNTTDSNKSKKASKVINAGYNSLGLRKNPFSGQILPSNHPTIPPYGPIRQKVENFIDTFLQNQASRGLVFIGDYGTGKTYHLRWMKSQFDEHPNVNVHTIYLETPGLEPYDLVRGILNEIGEEQIAKGIWNLLQHEITKEIKTNGQEEYLGQFAYEIEVKPKGRSVRKYNLGQSQMQFKADYFGRITDDDLLDHRKFLAAFDKTGRLSREKLRDHYQRVLFGIHEPAVTNNVAVARELASICFYSGAPALNSWESLVIPGAGSPKAFPPQGEPAFLQSVVRVLVKSGVEYLVLFLDEFEKVPLLQTMTEREAKRYLDTFRMLIDKNWHELPFAWVLGSNEDAWAWIEKENRALPQRIITRVTLPRADDPKLAYYIIRGFLNEARLPDSKLSSDDSIFPFPDNLLDLIPLALRRTPRDLVKLCDVILEEAVQERHPKAPVSEQTIATVVESFSLE